MKPSRLLLALLFACFASAVFAQTTPDSGRVYELRTYTVLPGRMPAMLTRFRDHTTKLFAKHGMVNVGYWVPADEKDGAADTLIYLLEHKNREVAKASWKAFVADADWQAAQKKSEADGKIVAKLDSVFLTATDYTKAMDAGMSRAKNAGAARIFELRTYTTLEGKLGNLDARFRDHTVALFAKQGMTNLGYFHPVDADKGAANTLIYFLAHKDREAAAASWKAFRDDADWAKARTASEKDGKITAGVKSVFLKPVDFSALQ